MIENIIFDVDGTLWDSSETVAKSWNAAYACRGNPRRFSVEEISSYMGMTLEEIAEKACAGMSEEERRDAIRECTQSQFAYLAREGGTVYPGVRETIERLSASYGIYIVSNCECGYIETMLAFAGLQNYVKDFLCAGMTGKGKGDNLLALMEKNRLKNCVYVGDTRLDERACEKAEIPFIWAAYGFGKAESPAATLRSFPEVEQVVKTL